MHRPIRPHGNSPAATAVTDVIDIQSVALVLMIGLVDVSIRQLQPILHVPLVDDGVGDALEPAIKAAVFRARTQRRSIGTEGDHVIFPSEIIRAFRDESGKSTRRGGQEFLRQLHTLERCHVIASLRRIQHPDDLGAS